MQDKKTTHTPTPWQVVYSNVCSCPAASFHDLQDCSPICSPIEKADAAFIVRAVNAHEELLKVARDYYFFLRSVPRTTDTAITRMHVENVIAKGEGKI